MSAGLDRVDDWSAERRAELFEQIDAIFNPGTIGIVEFGEPFLEQTRTDDAPRDAHKYRRSTI